MQYDLVFEGGGAKGIVFAGAMTEFFRQGHSLGRLLGTSAGAITAVLLAAGYSAEEMLAALEEQVDGKSVFCTFLAPPPALPAQTLEQGLTLSLLQRYDNPLVPNVVENLADHALLAALNRGGLGRFLLSLLERGGLYAADAFVDWLRRKLNTGQVNGQPRAWGTLTLAEFAAATSSDLTLVAADTSARQMLVLNARTAPDLPVVWAVRMSMSVPVVWQEVLWQPAWGKYRGATIAGHSIVDGGLLSNFPLELFLSNLPNVTAVMGQKSANEILGLLLDDDAPIPGLGSPPASQPTPWQRWENLLWTALNARDNAIIAAFPQLVARLPAGGVGLTQFDLTAEQRRLMLQAGEKAMRSYFGRPLSFAPASAEVLSLADSLALRRLQQP